MWLFYTVERRLAIDSQYLRHKNREDMWCLVRLVDEKLSPAAIL